MIDYQKIRERIVEIYEKKVWDLSLGILGHFFARYFAVSGKTKYQNIIAWNIQRKYYSQIEKLLWQFKTKNFKRVDIDAAITKKPRKKRRELFYRHNPEVRFYENFLLAWFYVNKYNLQEKFPAKFRKEVQGTLKKINFRKAYDNDEAIISDSSYLFNSVIFLKHLGIDLKLAGLCEQRLYDLYIGGRRDLKSIPQPEYQSFVYSMTHIIIADSRYYECFVSGHKWIIDYFVNNLDEIVKRTTPDILAEVGFCLRLCKQDKKYPELINKIKKTLQKQIDWERLEKDIDYLRKKEHTNSILVMLYSNNDKFYRPADLSNHPIF
jgi:hypothetical protein